VRWLSRDWSQILGGDPSVSCGPGEAAVGLGFLHVDIGLRRLHLVEANAGRLFEF